jgi:hypothetical protein
MKTEQADSPRVAESIILRFPLTIWLNLVCLDAPLVAIGWLGLFASTFHRPVQPGNAVALFLTAWLIYLTDRLADSLWLKPGTPRSLRHDFCLRHREAWTATVIMVGGFDGYVVWRATASETFFAGTIVGVLALIYLVLNHPFGRIWRTLPAKELAIGVLFAAGTFVALVPPMLPMSSAFVISALAFATLCSLNCISIAGWERDLDAVQGKVSIATRFPAVPRLMTGVCLVVAVICFVIAITAMPIMPLFVCIGLSAALLASLNASRSHGIDERTALADLVLLTPVAALVVLR